MSDEVERYADIIRSGQDASRPLGDDARAIRRLVEAEIRRAKADVLREAAQTIRRATHDRLQRYDGAPKETASLAIDGTVRLLERLADEAGRP